MRLKANFKLAFWIGVILHVLLVYLNTRFLDFECLKPSCTSHIFADMPISILYLAFPEPAIIILSLLIGSALWGIYAIGFMWLLEKIFK